MSKKLIEIYDKLYNDAIEKIKSDHYELDAMVDSTVDNRRGVTLIIKPDLHVIEQIEHFLDRLRSIEPNQYYYPCSDIHVTCLPIISCHENFHANTIPLQDYIDLIRMNLSAVEPFEIDFQGITASSSCIMIQGFFKENILNDLRNRFRQSFKDSSLEQNIDHRYVIQTAHATVVRFKNPLINKETFLEVLNNYRKMNFGTTIVKQIDFVFNDWYLKDNVTKTLARFQMKYL